MWSKKYDTSGGRENIPEGEYNLLQSVGTHKPIHVKLTDSCLKVFENYVSSGNKAAISLQLSEGQGKLVIPTLTNEPQVFSFYTTHLKTELECYKHDISGVEFLSLGGIGDKLTIRANEESYSTTREKMNMVKEQEQKSTTKVLKSIGKSSRKSRKHMPIQRTMITSSENTTYKYKSVLQKSAANTERSHQEPPPKSSMMKNNMYRKIDNTDMSRKPTIMSTVKRSVVGSEHANRYKSALQSFSATEKTNEELTPKHSNSLSKDLEENTIHLLAVDPLTFTDLFLKISSIDRQPTRADLNDVLHKVATVDCSNPQRLLYTLKETFMSKINVDWPKFSAKQKSSLQARLLENGIGRKGQKRASSELCEVDVENNVLNEVDSGVKGYSVSGKKKRVSLVKNTVVGNRDGVAMALEPQPTKKPKEKKKKKAKSSKAATAEAIPHHTTAKQVLPPQSLSNYNKEKTPTTANSTMERIFHPQPTTENLSDLPYLSVEKPATNKMRFVKSVSCASLSSESSDDQVDLQNKTAVKEPLHPFSEPNMNGVDKKKHSKWKVTKSPGPAELSLNLTLRDVSISGKKKIMSATAQRNDHDQQQKHCGDLVDSFDVASMSQEEQKKPMSHYKSTAPSNDENSQESDSYCYDDYAAKFTTITSKLQRDEYYAVFQELYSLYKQLYVNVSTYTRRFEDYKRQYKLGSKCRKELKRAVWKDYRLLKSDNDFVEKKKKIDHMHSKLLHIKQLVHLYDTTVG